MTEVKDRYENPLCERYASEKMQYIFSPDFKFSAWRRLWCSLAANEAALGVPITAEQVAELRAHTDDIDYAAAAAYERELRHDVMAHIRTYADACPKAAPIIHLGATSCFVDDNADVMAMREGLLQLRRELVNAAAALTDLCGRYADVPVLAYTHYQAAQPTTVGKRACLWLQDLLMDLERLDFELSRLSFPGCKGATGTAASFLELFGGDAAKVEELERRIAADMGFDRVLPVSGQTYTRKIDSQVLGVLSGIAQSCSKMATDLRLMAHEKEFDEPFEEKQVGSSAMAYKRNPMRCERICALSRFLITDTQNAAYTASQQWLERSLDDSANRRLSIPEAFLAADGILSLAVNVISGCRFYPRMMREHIDRELPFLATENILMRAVEKGGDRQELHEVIRGYAVAAARAEKEEGAPNDLLARIAADGRFRLTAAELEDLLDVRKFIGLAPEQTRRFLAERAQPVLEQYRDLIGSDGRRTISC